MSTAMDETPTPANIPKYRSSPLKIHPLQQSVVEALLDEGIPHRSIEKATGLSTTTICKVKHQRKASSQQVEKIKKNLRNRFASIADKSLSTLTDEKLEEASAKDLIYIASKATEIALGGQASVVETYTQSLKAYMTDETPQPVGGPGEITKTVTITKPSNP